VGLGEMVYSGNHGFEIVRVGVTSEEGPPEITAEADLVVDGVGGVSELLRELLKEKSHPRLGPTISGRREVRRMWKGTVVCAHIARAAGELMVEVDP
jgi:hypothetical protein